MAGLAPRAMLCPDYQLPPVGKGRTPAHPRRAVAFPRTPSKSLQRSALCFHIRTTSKQPAVPPVEKRPYQNTDNTFNPCIYALSQLPDIKP